MIDNIRIRKQIDISNHVALGINEPFDRFNLTFYPINKKGDVRGYKAELMNLMLTIKSDTLTISNSLCKYYFGNNYQNFSHLQINQAVTKLENTLDISLRDAKLISFEFGVVLSVKETSKVYRNWGAYKSKPILPMQVDGRIYGAYFENSTHRLKCYDKKFETWRRYRIRIDRNLIRVEKRISLAHINSSPRFKNNNIRWLGDLCRLRSLELLGDDLVSSLLKIELKNIPEKYSQLSTSDLRIWGYFQFQPIKIAMQKLHFETYKSDRAKYLEIQKDYQKYNQNAFTQEVMSIIHECLDN